MMLAEASDSQAWTNRVSLSAARVDDEQGAGFARCGGVFDEAGVEVVVDGAVGGFLEFLRFEERVGESRIGKGWIGRYLFHGLSLLME